MKTYFPENNASLPLLLSPFPAPASAPEFARTLGTHPPIFSP